MERSDNKLSSAPLFPTLTAMSHVSFPRLPLALLTAVLLSPTIRIDAAPGADERARAFIAAHESRIRPLEKQSALVWWNSNTTGRDEDFKAPLDALNRVIFNQLVQLSLKQPNTERANTWFFLDELREAGKLDRINALIVEGRSHGIRVVIGFQDIDGLREVYGEHAANEIAGVCVNKAFLRLDSESTAQWAAKLIGDAEHREFTTTVSSNVQNNRETTSTRNESVVKREAALASQLMRSDMPDKQRKLFYGYYITPAIGVYAGRVHFGPLRDPARNVRNFVPHPDQHQYLPRRTDDDERRLGFSPSIAEREPSHDSPTPEPTMERITLDDLRQEIDP